MHIFRDARVLMTLLVAILGATLPAHAGPNDGPCLVMDIRPGATGAFYDGSALFSNGRQVFFKANDGVHGYQLWVSDGTPQGTRMLTNTVNSDAYGLSPFVADRAGRVYFIHSDPAHGSELWVSDGTVAGTKMLRDWYPGLVSGIDPSGNLVLLGPHVYFIGGADTSHWGLCRTDGTAAGMQMVNAFTGSDSYARGPLRCYGPFNGRIFITHTHYTNRENMFQVQELWSSDGTAAGTQYLDGFGTWSSLYPMVASLGGNLYLLVDTMYGDMIWKTDCTPAGTAPVYTPGAQDLSCLTVFRGGLYFFGVSRADGKAALYSFDAAASAATKVVDLPYDRPVYACAEDGDLFFATGSGLWTSDGTTSGTIRIKAMRVSECYQLPGLRRWLFSGSIDNFAGWPELWRTDGTASGTQRIPWPEGASSTDTGYPSGFVRCGDWVLFTVYDWRGLELWRLPLNPYYNPVRAWDAFR